ncbi:DUF11 domain-containing protein [Trichocoleus sp. FACHB-591]|uniref:DUF11 domain-containing protein n=1 Tax=Trichocoleus sp. FACHB-591 TaxID=2692872 RepID=UPI001689AFF0|nr:DUF11 domain-containing protein [Trichocoleus sp. FACHB-591]MBD2097295.1 DUF11 domain-containing protein [Trichocoleus sp. FACHB-591]
MPLSKKHIFSLKNWSQWAVAITVASSLQHSLPVLAKGITTTQLSNQASYTYSDSVTQKTFQGNSAPVSTSVDRLVDPFGRIRGCAGETLSSYDGFSLGIYETNPGDPTGASLNGLVSLTKTELPDIANNGIPAGIAPNSENNNPFFFTDSDEGTYNFLLDPKRGQIDVGKAYILVISPPENTGYSQRRIRIIITARTNDTVSYTATSLDGKPISSTDNRSSVSETINIQNAEGAGLVLALLDVDVDICQSQGVQIIKTGDRAAAEPGDTVIYRLSVKNLATAAIDNVVITDTLPVGFNFRPDSVRAEIANQPVAVTTNQNGSTVTFQPNVSLLPQADNQSAVLNIAYAAVLTPDAVRGTGLNSAVVSGDRVDNRQGVKDGPATHRLRIRSGILSDCGTIIGRVFVDKNFDGEQQRGEPGVPNAVVFMDDGNRITTDPNGLFSVSNVISGYRTGVLDLTSVSGYTFAPNLYVKERNSQSRLVHLQPGGLVRMNFAVTPASSETKNQ